MSTCQTDSTATIASFIPIEVVSGVAQIPGLEQLWARTFGDPRICIAVLDGPVDLSHPAFRGAALSQVSAGDVKQSSHVVSDHGTHVTSIIFGQHHSSVKGIAPRCRGLIVPIFDYAEDGSLKPSSQERLAKAIRTALHYGANIINISGGQFTSDGQASEDLKAAVTQCEGKAIIIAAVGNDGCDCLHVPGAISSVLAVGAMDKDGEPLSFSNWGEAYREHGVLAPGQHILGASLAGRVAQHTGTSFATPIVSGIAGLALSAVLQSEQLPKPSALRSAILQSAIDCNIQPTSDCSKLLSGRLNVSGVVEALQRGSREMHEMTYSDVTNVSVRAVSTPSQIETSGCGCDCSDKSQPVYAIGEIDYDFPSLSRLNSLQQSMASLKSTGQQLNVQNRLDFARHLCGFNEHKLTVAGGLLSWDPNVPTATVGGDKGFKLQIPSGDDLIAADDFRRILIHGVRERRPLKTGGFGPWQPWRLNGQALPIGWIDASTFILRNASNNKTYEYDFGSATWVLPRECDESPRIHSPHEYDAQSVVWKLRRGSTNFYAIRPGGNYSEAAYGELIDFLLEGQGFDRTGLDIYYFDTPHGRQFWSARWDPTFNVRDCCLANEDGGSHACCTNYQKHDKDDYPTLQGRFLDRSQRVSVPGVTGGKVHILNGEMLTEIAPDMRGTHSWSLIRLHQLINKTIQDMGSIGGLTGDDLHRALLEIIMPGMDSVLAHLDERVRNRGMSAQDRAINYAATRLVDILPDVAGSLVVSSGDQVSTFALDEVGIPVKSTIGPPGTDCWEVEIAFFNPDNAFAARIIVSQAVDVSDVIPYRIEDPKVYRKR